MDFKRSLIFILILNLIGCADSPLPIAYAESVGAAVRVKDADNTNTTTMVADTAANNSNLQPMQATIEVTNCGTL